MINVATCLVAIVGASPLTPSRSPNPNPTIGHVPVCAVCLSNHKSPRKLQLSHHQFWMVGQSRGHSIQSNTKQVSIIQTRCAIKTFDGCTIVRTNSNCFPVCSIVHHIPLPPSFPFCSAYSNADMHSTTTFLFVSALLFWFTPSLMGL